MVRPRNPACSHCTSSQTQPLRSKPLSFTLPGPSHSAENGNHHESTHPRFWLWHDTRSISESPGREDVLRPLEQGGGHKFSISFPTDFTSSAVSDTTPSSSQARGISQMTLRNCQLLNSRNLKQNRTLAAVLKATSHGPAWPECPFFKPAVVPACPHQPFLARQRPGWAQLCACRLRVSPGMPHRGRAQPSVSRTKSSAQSHNYGCRAEPSPRQPELPRTAISAALRACLAAQGCRNTEGRLFSAQRKASASSGYFFQIFHCFLYV